MPTTRENADVAPTSLYIQARMLTQVAATRGEGAGRGVRGSPAGCVESGRGGVEAVPGAGSMLRRAMTATSGTSSDGCRPVKGTQALNSQMRRHRRALEPAERAEASK